MIDWMNFKTAFDVHRRALVTPRRYHREAIERIVGAWYGDGGSAQSQPLNVMELAFNIHRIYLSSNCPQATFSCRKPEQRAAAYELQLAVNHLAKYELELERVLERMVVDALTAPFGVVKVGVTRDHVELFGTMHEYGNPYVSNVSLDDYVFDTAANEKRERHFEGHYFSVPYEKLMDSGLIPSAKKDRVKSSERSVYDETGTSRTDNIAFGANSDRLQNRVYKMVGLWEFYYPQDRAVGLWLADDNLGLSQELPLTEGDFEGPDVGPYHELVFEDIPGQPYGLPPVSLWRDLHDVVNTLYRKLCRQAEEQKSNPTFTGQSAGDAERLNGIPDGKWARVEDAQHVGVVKRGGPDQANFAFTQDALNQANFFTGNPASLAGLQPQTDTFKQDSLLAQSASKRLEDMQRKAVSSTAGIFRSVAWHVLNEPGKVVPLVKTAKGINHTIHAYYTPDRRVGSPTDYIPDVDPFSMRRLGPAEKMKALDASFDRILQVAPLAAGQGIVPNVEAYLKARAKYTGVDEVEDLVTFADPQVAESSDAPQAGPAPGAGGVYEHVSRSAGGGRGAQQANVAAMMAGTSPGGNNQMSGAA